MALQKTPLTSSPAHTPAPLAIKPPTGKKISIPKISKASSLPFWIGLGISLAWVSGVIAIIGTSGPERTLGGVSLVDWAIGISASVSPVAMIWMITAYLQRASDVESVADPLRRQLTLITGESGAADARIRRFNQAIREQIDLLRSAQSVSQEDLEAIMDRVQQHRADLERFENVSAQQVKEIQDVVRRSMFQIEQMMDDKFTMLRVLDGKLQKNGDGVARQVEGIGEQVSKMLEEVEQATVQISQSLERAQLDTQRLADTSRLQESSLSTAAEAASETLSGLSSKIDLSVARFLERASAAREESERMTHALDAQTRTLEDLSTTLPVRVGEAESILRGVADRLYASEQLAHEQANKLSDHLAHQADGLQTLMERFMGRLVDVDASLDRRQSDLNHLIDRVGSTTSEFINSFEKSVSDLNMRTDGTMARFSAVNDDARANAEAIAAHLDETTGKYEGALTRLRTLSSDSNDHMKNMADEIARHVAQFEELNVASNKAGKEVETRASVALQNLQQVLERVLSVRDATQSVGEKLAKDINDAMAQNEKMVQRLGETVQLSTRAISAATENFGRQQSDLSGKTRASEAILLEAVQKLQAQAEVASKNLRDHSAGLLTLLSETQNQLATTDQKMQSFAAQAVTPVQKAVDAIGASAEQGLQSLGVYGEGLSTQVGRLQDFHSRVQGMSHQMSRATADTVLALETLEERFGAARATQEDAARQTLAQFTDLSDSLKRETQGLDGQAAHALECLQQAARSVGEESYQMLEKAKTSATHVKDVASSLTAEASRIETLLRQQTEAISSDLTGAEQKFTMLGEIVRERASAAHVLLDRAATRYSEVTDKMDQTVNAAQIKVDTLHSALQREADQIATDAAKIEMHAGKISVSSDRAAETLSTLNAKMAAAHETSLMYSQKALSKLDDTITAFQDRTNTMTHAAQTAADAIVGAAGTFGEHTVKLVDGGQEIAGLLDQLSKATGTLTDQASSIRVNMEQENSLLLSHLEDSVARLTGAEGKLRQVADTATRGADQATQRFNDMASGSTKTIDKSTQELHAMAERAEKTLSTLGAHVTQQAATLAVVGDQIGEQQRVLAESTEKQRVQMFELFDKLSAAHAEASGIAERTIAYLSSALKDIERQVGDVGDKSQAAIGNVKIASMGFTDQASLLLQNAQAAEQQARTVLTATSALQEQAHQLRLSLQNESERAGESLQMLLERLTKGGGDVRDIGASTNAALTTLHHALEQQAGELNVSMNQIGDRQRTLTTALNAQRDVIDGLMSRLTGVQEETASVAERAANRLTESVTQITTSVGTIDRRAHDALNSLQKATAGFAYEAESIEKKARQTEEDARVIVTSASGANEKLGALCATLREEGDLTNSVYGSLLSKITAGSAELRDISSSTEMSLMTLGNNATQQCAALAALVQQINDRQQQLGTSLDSQREIIKSLFERLADAQAETIQSSDRLTTRLTQDAQKIAISADVIDTRAQSALSSVRTATESFAKEAEAIDIEAKRIEEQAQTIFSTTTSLHGQIYDLRLSMQADGERTNETLDALLGRLSAGAHDMHEAGYSAEKTLSSVQQSIGEKAGLLAKALQQIDDRQKTLAIALDSQRDTIGGLITRFMGVQNETAATAERTAERLQESATSITHSMDAIGTKAQETLANVAASVGGFAQQAVALNHEGQKAEQQLRGIVSAASGIGEQAVHLRDSVQSLDQTTKRFTEVTKDGAELIRSQTEALSQTLDQSEGRLTSIGEKMHAHLRVVGEMGDKAETQTEALANAAEYATTRLAVLRDTITATEKAGHEVVERAASRIEEVKGAMQGQLQHLSDLSHKAAEHVLGASKALAMQNDTLRTNLAKSEQAFAKVSESLKNEAKQLPATLKEGLIDIETAARALKAQSMDANKAMIDTADRFISVTASTRSNMVEEMKRVGGVAEDAGRILNGFNQLLAEQVAAMQQSTAKLSGEQRDLIEKASVGVDSLAEAGQRLLTLRNEATVTAERLVRDFDQLDQRAATTGGRLAQAGEGIVKQIEAISEATTRAENRIVTTGDTLRDHMESIRGALQGQIDEISNGLMKITAQLERTSTSLRSTTVGAVSDVERVSKRFEETGATAVAQVDAGTNRMRQSMEEVSRLLASFSGKFDQMIDHMAQAGADIKSQEGSALEHLQQLLSHLSTIAEKVENTRALSGDLSVHAIEKLDEVVTAVQSQMSNMAAGANTAAGIMRGIGQIYNDQTTALNKGVSDAHNQVVGMNKSIDEMQQRTDRMRTALKTQGEDLMRSLGQILMQLEATGDGLTDAVSRTLEAQATAGAKKIS